MTRILIAAANPKSDLNQVRVDLEMREIEAGLRAAKQRDRFHLEKRTAVRLRDLYLALLDVQPQIVHFCGHASSEGLLLETDRGAGRIAPVKGVASLLKMFSDHLDCVVLNACLTEPLAEALADHIPYVVGMSGTVGDWAATQFAVAFYDALGAGRPVDFSFDLACAALEALDLPAKNTPVLKRGRDRSSIQTGGLSYPELQAMGLEEIRDFLARARKLAESEPSWDLYIRIGLLYLQLRLCEEADRYFEKAVELAPERAEGHYYRALTLLRYRRPKEIDQAEVAQIERHLERAISLSPQQAHPLYLLALLRYDFYFKNGLRSPRPFYDELFRSAGSREYNHGEIERLLAVALVRDPQLIAVLRRH